MRFIELFSFCEESREEYPYNVLSPKVLGITTFSPVTILYGRNGSGKSTALNAIARSMRIPNLSKGSDSLYFEDYVRSCQTVLAETKPKTSLFIRSEDVMEAINKARKEYESFDNDVRANGFDPESIYGNFTLSLSSEFKWIFSRACQLTEQWSNGEVAMMFFDNIITPDSLYFLDEPETSFSPAFQQKLAEKIEYYARYLGCQFVISSHSPFILGIEEAQVIDLDLCPAVGRSWTRLPGIRTYYDFFMRNAELFEKV